MRPKSRWRSLTDFFWPRMGWRRYGRMMLLQFATLRGGAAPVARGLALGVAWSCTPFLGIHAVMSVLCCYPLKASIFAAMFGVLVIGNAALIPLFWTIDYWIGINLMGIFGFTVDEGGFSLKQLSNWSYLWQNMYSIFIPIMFGSFILAPISFMLIHFSSLRYLKQAQKSIRAYHLRIRMQRRNRNISL